MYSEPTIDTHPRYEDGAGDNFGAYQERQVQGDELFLVRNGIDPIISQIRVRSHFDVPGTDLRSTKMSETMRRNRPMTAPVS